MAQPNRVLAIGLDGLEISHAEERMQAGEMPNLEALRDRSASFLLENPPKDRTGLEWAQFAESEPPGPYARQAPVTFDPDTYETWQAVGHSEPFLERLDRRTVVFDTPYVDMARAPSVRGAVAWGAHDPGTRTADRPAGLVEDIGPYPSSESIYALPWPSAERCRSMGADLVAGLRARGTAAVRLMTGLTPDWEVFVAVAGELHSANEALWHGVDPDHPLHDHSSAGAARTALDATHRAADEFLGTLLDSADPDVRVVVFTMGGMGPNLSDVPSMVLLAELLHRRAYGTAWLQPRDDWACEDPPMLGPDESWSHAVLSQLPSTGLGPRLTRLAWRLPGPVRRSARRAQQLLAPPSGPGGTDRLPLDWMPAAAYADRWSNMDAFALPSYYQGRIRVNLEGRERDGRVPGSELGRTLDDLEGLLRACRDPRTGEDVVAGFERPGVGDPRGAGGDHADLVVQWKGMPTALRHPDLGLVGPVPYRRVGGHTGTYGFCYVAGPDVEPRPPEIRSAFDVAPTIATLAGGRAEGGRPLVTVPDPVV